ncbi:MAG TPA: ATP-binding protein [Hanamia sp.]|nr:ATP-binding protein [Hanamia sp.]
MKYLLSLVFALASIAVTAQHKLEKIWETDSIIPVPESVLFDGNILYVSLIDGGGWDADGIGGVGKLSLNGKNFDGKWITGLNAPKGLGKFGNKLYVADISEVVVIDIKNDKIEKKIQIEGASGLNDITVSSKGVVYASDSKTSTIWKIQNDKPSLYLENIKGANGLKAIGNDLLFAQGKDLMKADAKKSVSKIAQVTEGIDGIEPVGNGDYIVTSWVGYIYYVQANGHFETLLDTRSHNKNAADIGYDAAKKIVYVPTFMGKTVAAYKLK